MSQLPNREQKFFRELSRLLLPIAELTGIANQIPIQLESKLIPRMITEIAS